MVCALGLENHGVDDGVYGVGNMLPNLGSRGEALVPHWTPSSRAADMWR
jgi:hypothetical protein